MSFPLTQFSAHKLADEKHFALCAFFSKFYDQRTTKEQCMPLAEFICGFGSQNKQLLLLATSFNQLKYA
jgi:hypothetical protein